MRIFAGSDLKYKDGELVKRLSLLAEKLARMSEDSIKRLDSENQIVKSLKRNPKVEWVYEGGAAINLATIKYMGYTFRNMHDLDLIMSKPIVLLSKEKDDETRRMLEFEGFRVEKTLKHADPEFYVIRSLKVVHWDNMKIDLSFPLYLDGVKGVEFSEVISNKESMFFGKYQVHFPMVDYMLSRKLKVNSEKVSKKTQNDLRQLQRIREVSSVGILD
ncbi:MAG: hypothetical protein KGH71_02605 [Candidatus Micrarchaeota archaeon]|nr:hypothetical protein [Candidatus Micrarchaeota archaeon]